MARFYGSEFQVSLDSPDGTVRRVAITDDFAVAVENATFELTPFGVGAKIYDYVRQYGIAAFDLGAYADDDPLVAAPGISGFSRVVPMLLGATPASRTLSIQLRSGVTVAFEVIFGSATLNLTHGTEAVKRMANCQPTGPLTVTGSV